VSFWKKLFGGGGAKSSSSHAPIEHEGFTIVPKPMPDGGQFRLGATISKEIDGVLQEHTLIRADLFPSEDQCAEFAISKAKLVIKEQGDRLFK